MSAIALMGVDTAEKFEKLTKPYRKLWFLSAFWEEYFKDEAAKEKFGNTVTMEVGS